VTVNNNFLLSADWFALRAVIVETLRAHPAARADIVKALRTFEQQRGVAVDIGRARELPATIHEPQSLGQP
jgi:hypothetical protein